MKSPQVPTTKELENAYHHLIGKKNVSEVDFVFYSRFVRFDPRLGEAWLTRMRRDWKKISPVSLRDKNLNHLDPAIFGVLLEQVEVFLISKQERKLFRLWKNAVLWLTPKGDHAQFLIGVKPLGSDTMMDDAEFPAREYIKWGYLGRDVFLNKFLQKQKILQKTTLQRAIRNRKLNSFLSHCKKNSKERITIEDYLQFCEFAISRRIAQLDLKKSPNLRAIGNTRSRFYVFVGSQK
jgi:hypothetical protein